MNDNKKNLHPDISFNSHPIITGDYIIVTPQIKILTDNILFLITNKITGAIVYGISRGGKTTAKRCLIKAIRNFFKGNSLIFSVSCNGGRFPNENRFLADILGGLGLAIKNRERPEERRERIIRYLTSLAQETQEKKIILFMDDAQNMKELDYIQLMDIYNRLEDIGITLSTILIGSDELKELMDTFISKRKSHIVGRFMIHDFNFKGVENLNQLQLILSFYDQKCYPTDSNCSYTQYFFPEAYDKGYRVSQDAELILKLICEEADISINSPILNIPMLPLTLTINDCFKLVGFIGKSKYKPTEEDWKTSIERAKYSRYMM